MASSSTDLPPAKRPCVPARGGHRQKQRWAQQEDVRAPPATSHLAEYLLEKWSWGSLSTPVLQTIAACAVKDGNSHQDVTLSKLGSSGKYPNNMYSELIKKLKHTPITDALDEITVWSKKEGKPPVQVTHKILLPHHLFASLYHNHHEILVKSIMGGSSDEPEKLWQAMAANPTYKNHPVAKRMIHQTLAIPIAVHGDGVQTSGCGKSWAKGCDVYS